MEEVGVSGIKISKKIAETLINDDGVSTRHIYAGVADTADFEPSVEIAQSTWTSEVNVPDCRNRNHILAAVASARKVL
jgi:hypothetical protein